MNPFQFETSIQFHYLDNNEAEKNEKILIKISVLLRDNQF